MTGRRILRAAAIAGVAAVLAGCGDGSPPAAELPEGVTVALVQLRADVAVRQAQVQIVNGTDAPVHVGDVRVEDERFDGAATRVVDRESTIPAGGTVNVRVQLPRMDCAADAEGVAASTVDIEFAGGSAVAELPDPLGFVAPLHARECLAQRLAGIAELKITDFAPSGQTATIDLAVRATGEGRARIDAVHSTTLLMYAAGAPAGRHEIGLEIDGAHDAATVRIPLVPQRCDPHVVQEDKRGTIFTFDVVVDGVEGQVDIPADADTKARILSWVAVACGFAPG